MEEPILLSRRDILRLFELLNVQLGEIGIQGEVYRVGGAVMFLALNARAATRDLDAWIETTKTIREAAARVAMESGAPADWLDDAVKGWLSARGEFDPFLDLSHLKVFVARPEYLLAMKCASTRLGEQFHDLDDIRYLLRYLNITSVEMALDVVTKYFDESQLPPKTRLVLEEILG